MTAMTKGENTMVIDRFREDYYFLSNFYPAKIVFEGHIFGSAEAAFQAMKCPSRVTEFVNLDASQAKRLGRQVSLRADWDEVKDDIMYRICKGKFLQDMRLAGKLLATGDAELIEGNTWGDIYWGVCDGKGENHLGKILMKIRDELNEIMSKPEYQYTDEVGGYHQLGMGVMPGGLLCPRCNSASCGICGKYYDHLAEGAMPEKMIEFMELPLERKLQVLGIELRWYQILMLKKLEKSEKIGYNIIRK